MRERQATARAAASSHSCRTSKPNWPIKRARQDATK
jgi:hypothetical protein